MEEESENKPEIKKKRKTKKDRWKFHCNPCDGECVLEQPGKKIGVLNPMSQKESKPVGD